jgi:hypothetical protein
LSKKRRRRRRRSYPRVKAVLDHACFNKKYCLVKEERNIFASQFQIAMKPKDGQKFSVLSQMKQKHGNKKKKKYRDLS